MHDAAFAAQHLNDMLMQPGDVFAARLVNGGCGGKAADGAGPGTLGTELRAGFQLTDLAVAALDRRVGEQVPAAFANVSHGVIVLFALMQTLDHREGRFLRGEFAEEYRSFGCGALVVSLRFHPGSGPQLLGRQAECPRAWRQFPVVGDHLIQLLAVLGRPSGSRFEGGFGKALACRT